MKAHLSCYHSTMTEHKVIPVHERQIPLRHVHKNDFILPFFLSLSPLMSCVTAGFCICLLSCWSDAIRFLFSVVPVLLQQRIAYKIPARASCSLGLMSWHQCWSYMCDIFSKADISATDDLHLFYVELNSVWMFGYRYFLLLCSCSYETWICKGLDIAPFPFPASVFNNVWSASKLVLSEASFQWRSGLKGRVSEFN